MNSPTIYKLTRKERSMLRKAVRYQGISVERKVSRHGPSLHPDFSAYGDDLIMLDRLVSLGLLELGTGDRAPVIKDFERYYITEAGRLAICE